MTTGLISGFSGITNGDSAIKSAKLKEESSKFLELVEKMQHEKTSTLSSSEIKDGSRLEGDYSTGFQGTFTNPNEKAALPQGAASNQAGVHAKTQKIDKTSKLYEKSMELESYFVKQMLSEMRKTVHKSSLGGEGFAGEMYEDMLFEEYSTSMTKTAGFGLADQIYLSLAYEN